MRRSVDRPVRRQTWLMTTGMIASAVGLVIAAQDHHAGLYLAVIGGLVAVGAYIARG